MSLGVGVIGCGMVSHAYLSSIVRGPDLSLRALASRTMTSAERQAALYGGKAMSVEALLADPEVAIVVNLAPPALHHALGRRILEAGKHLYSEKPFATRLEDAHDLIALAEARGLLIGAAPDTFLGEGNQAARRLVDSGRIGPIIGGAMAFGTRGMEGWHPDPAFFYAPGGGPLLDVGPYYLTQLVNLLGPVAEVTAIGSRPCAERTVRSAARRGEVIRVEVPTTVSGALLFASGANVSLAMSWDVQAHGRHPIELYGVKGTIQAPDPNQFGGEPRVHADGRWTPAEPPASGRMDEAALADFVQKLGQGVDALTGGPVGPDTLARIGDRRGLGLLDLAQAIKDGRPPHCSARLAAHVLETLLALQTSAVEGGRIRIRSVVDRPEPVERVD